MSSPRPLRPESPVTPLHSQAAANLRFIRQTMERAASFTAVPGWGLVQLGLLATVAAVVSAVQPDTWHWIAVWLAVAIIATPYGFWTMHRKARKLSTSLWSTNGRKVLLSFLPPVVASACLSVPLMLGHHDALLAPSWLLMYGAGIMAAGSHSVSTVPLMGGAFMGLGVLAFFTPLGWSSVMMGLGFGVLHLVFGTLIARRHGG
ncbi:MAG TPA: hypothetical protein V6D47_08520 [Oscillatoriaceae cyanobacterium]